MYPKQLQHVTIKKLPEFIAPFNMSKEANVLGKIFGPWVHFIGSVDVKTIRLVFETKLGGEKDSNN